MIFMARDASLGCGYYGDSNRIITFASGQHTEVLGTRHYSATSIYFLYDITDELTCGDKYCSVH